MIGLNFYAIGYTNVGILRQQSGLVGVSLKETQISTTYSYINTTDTVQCKTDLSESSLKTQCGLRLDNHTHFREPGSHIGRCCIFYSILPIAVSAYELIGFVIVFIGFLRSACKAVGPTDADGDKWYHFSLVAWSWLRMLSRFSAVMFLGHIHPSIILDAMHKSMEKRKEGSEEKEEVASLAGDHAAAESTLRLSDVSELSAGMSIRISDSETKEIIAVNPDPVSRERLVASGRVTIDSPLQYAHAHGASVLTIAQVQRITSRQRFNQLRFITTRLMLLLIGAICVTVKIENVHYVLEQTMETKSSSPKWVPRLLSAGLVMLAFLNQMMNMLDISHRLRLRALAFVFAGEDAIYQQDEMIEVYLYQTNVAEAIYSEFAKTGAPENEPIEQKKQRSDLFALAVLFCFNHQDVQRLAVSESKEGRSSAKSIATTATIQYDEFM